MECKINSLSTGTDHDAVTISGEVKRVIFHNEDNGYSVLSVQVRGVSDSIAVVGRAPAISEGETISAAGSWVHHKKFGRQFSAEFIHASSPQSQQGMRTYLSSQAIDGIGRVYADKLVDHFGTELFNVIEFEPRRLREVEGIGAKRARKIKDAWDRHRGQRDTMLFLHDHGIGAALATRIFKAYGATTIKAVGDNPYILVNDIRGIGFRTADAIAMKLGFDRADLRRVRAGLIHLTQEAADKGSCGKRIDELLEQTADLLEVRSHLVQHALQAELANGGLTECTVDGHPCAFLPHLLAAEESIAERIRILRQGTPPWKQIDESKAIPWFEQKSGIRLGKSQSHAVRLTVSGKFTVITGGPGVGKTTIVNSILKILAAVKVRIKLGAPTGRAARRLSEATGRSAATIHRLLHFDPETGGFRYDREHPLACDFLVIDEASMIDVQLMRALLQAVPDQAAIVLVGDIDQLPSVGPGKVLDDIIESGSVNVVRLVEVFRQAAASRIVTNAHQINAGRMPELSRPREDSDFYFVPAEEPEDAQDKVLKLICERIPDRFGLDPIQDSQVLSPMIRGSLGVQELNRLLQAELVPDRNQTVEKFGREFAVGDKVMQTHNNYEVSVFNGDIGFVVAIRRDKETITVNFDGRQVELGFDNLDSLMPAYAVTIHKSQGSEFPAVVIPIMSQHYIMLRRKLLYTGVTRGRRLVVLVGQEKAIRLAVNGRDSQWPRLSRLRGLLS